MRKLLTTVVVTMALISAVLAFTTEPAHAAARITVTNDRGDSRADLTYRTDFTLRGSGFQSIRGGFGGVYVAFGWVRDPAGGSWRPSRGGTTGHDYRYVPDAENANNAGFLKFVAFPGSSTASEAHAVMSADGSFTVDLAVPGPVFTTTDRSGNAIEVDCRKTTCGVITIGAHGVKNPSNETFTPVEFGNVFAGQEPAPPAPVESETTDTGVSTTAPNPSAEEAAGGNQPRSTQPQLGQALGKPRLKTDRSTAIAGNAMAFTARGFGPGEQVVAVLDDGVVSVGPLQAGIAGELAGVIALPSNLAVGTHQLRLTAAASGVKVTERFAVQQSATAAAVPNAPTSDAGDAGWRGLIVPLIFVLVAGLLFVAALLRLLIRRWRRGLVTAPGFGGAA